MDKFFFKVGKILLANTEKRTTIELVVRNSDILKGGKMEKITEKVACWLSEPGNSKAELARVLGVSRPTVARKLSEERPWTWPEAKAIAKLCNCTIEDLD